MGYQSVSMDESETEKLKEYFPSESYTRAVRLLLQFYENNIIRKYIADKKKNKAKKK